MAIRIAAKEPERVSILPTPSEAGAVDVSKKRRANGNAKQLITLRIDPEVIEFFKSGGPGWQSRINDELRKIAGR
ncbi:BrnA antitoxin family protein [Brucella endophytica]|nr:BrnA antitoxin family protein [Brucella endophytica]